MNLFQEAKTILDKDGKVNPLGPYGKMKLTGREVSTYFRRNKVKPGDIKKAVEVALDMGGAMDIASKEIKKFFGDAILKAKEVQNALRYANEETFRDDLNDLSEKFKPYSDKQYPRCVDFYIQFRGGKGDRITSEENKKDFIKATDMIDAYCKKNKIKQKPVYSTPMEGSSAYKVGLMIDKSYSKTTDYDDGKDLQPLYVALSKLKTAEDHGGGWSVMVPKGLGPVKEDEVEEGKDKIKYRGNLKGLKEGTITEAKNLMPAIQKIVDTKGAAKVGGVMLDMFTASMITTVYDKVNDQNKSRMEKSNIQTLVHIAHKVMGVKESINEEMISYRVKGMQRPEEEKFKKSAKMMGLKITMDKGKKDTVIVMSGTKKKLRDFDAVARGKSSYGDPSTIMHFDEK